MAETEKRHQPSGRAVSKPSTDPIDSGTRRAQQWGNGNCIIANLTQVGASVHGISDKDLVLVEVYDGGIWIEPVDSK